MQYTVYYFLHSGLHHFSMLFLNKFALIHTPFPLSPLAPLLHVQQVLTRIKNFPLDRVILAFFGKHKKDGAEVGDEVDDFELTSGQATFYILYTVCHNHNYSYFFFSLYLYCLCFYFLSNF